MFTITRLICLCFALCLCQGASAQIQVDSLCLLDFSLRECSGLITIDGRTFMHNDSGDAAKLYEVNTATGTYSRQISISNATHVDWEDICVDDTHVYIADMGNNLGTRTDLKVYKISKDDLLNNNSVTAQVILFSYADQTDFSGDNSNHNFDAEAMIALGDSLYIFTKNRGDYRSNIYPLSKQAGNYQLQAIDQINSQGLITAADFIADSSRIILTGYDIARAFVIVLDDVEGTQFSDAALTKHYLDLMGSFQMESVSFVGQDKYLAAVEGNVLGESVLYQLSLDQTLATREVHQNEHYTLFPNPCTDYFNLDPSFEGELFLYNALGQLVLATKTHQIDMSAYANGVYYVLLKDKEGGLYSDTIVKK